MPFLYNGLLNLLLVLSLFIFSKRKIKWAAIAFLLVGMLLLISPQFRSLFWGGKLSYYRTICLYHAFVISLLASIALDTFLTFPQYLGKHNTNIIIAIGLGLCWVFMSSVTLLHISDKTVIIDRAIVQYTYWAIILYSLLLTLIAIRKYLYIALIVLLLAVCYEAGTSSWRTLHYKRKIADVHYCTDKEVENAFVDLHKHEFTFYRIEKSFYTCGLNDPMFQNYYGMSKLYFAE